MKINYIFIVTLGFYGVGHAGGGTEKRSIQHYLDKEPHRIQPQSGKWDWLILADLGLEEFNGIENIANKEKIHVLSLTNNKFPKIPAGTFKGFDNLQTLTLNKCHIEKIDLGALDNLKELQLLNLDDNPLKTFNPAILNKLSKLRTLYLNNTQLSGLDQFPNLPDLEILYLHDNNFEQINPKVFAKLPKLKWLYLNNNPMSKPENTPYQEALKDALPNVTIKF